jgi:hypothetical protein
MIGSIDQSPRPALRVVRQGQARGSFGVTTGGRGRPPRSCERGRAVELVRDLGVWCVRRERQVHRTGLVAGIPADEAAVHFAAALGSHVGVDAGGQQGVLELQARLANAKQAGGDRVIDRAVQPFLVRQLADGCEPPVIQRGDDLQQATNGVR